MNGYHRVSGTEPGSSANSNLFIHGASQLSEATVIHTVQHSSHKIPYTYRRNGIYYFCKRVPKILQESLSLPPIIRFSLELRFHTQAQKSAKKIASVLDAMKDYQVMKKTEPAIKMEMVTIISPRGKVIFEGKSLNEEVEQASKFAEENAVFSELSHGELVDSVVETKSMPLINEMFDRWVAAWDALGLNLKTQESHKRNMAVLLSRYGDCRVDISPQQVDEVLQTVLCMPRGNRAPYSSMTVAERIQLAMTQSVPLEDRVSGFKHALKTYQSFYSWLRRMYIIDTNPFNERRIKDNKSNERGAFNEAEMQRIVDFAIRQEDTAKKWVPLIMCFTGMRNKEIESLKRSAIKQCETTKVYFIHVEDTKTESGTRRIPIAQQLLDIGFLSFVNNQSDGNLFDLPEKWLTRYFANTLQKKCELPSHDISGNKLQMYSVRHSVNTFIRAQGANEAISTAIIGHEEGHLMQRNYTKRNLLRLDELKRYVDGLPYGNT